MVFWLTNALSTGSILLTKSMSGPGKMDNLYFKDNIHLIDQGNAKLASILAAINGSITSSARGKSIIIIKMHYCFQLSMAIFHRYLFQHL